MDVASWFRAWLTRHPLKEPPALDLDRSRYTAEVMARVKAHGQTVWVPARRWTVFPRAAFAMATVAASITVVFGLTRWHLRPPVERLAETITDEQWIEQTLQVLEQLDEGIPPEDAVEGTSDDEWFEELQILDDLELSAAS